MSNANEAPKSDNVTALAKTEEATKSFWAKHGKKVLIAGGAAAAGAAVGGAVYFMKRTAAGRAVADVAEAVVEAS